MSTTGGGDVKIEAKANGNGKPKVGSMDNIGLEAEDGQNKVRSPFSCSHVVIYMFYLTRIWS